jgi:hypothetical protein
VADERSPDAVEAVGRLNPGPVREELLKKLMAERRPEEDKMLDRLLDDVVGQIRRRWYKERYRGLQKNIFRAQEAGDADLCSRLLMEKERLLREEKRAQV